MNTATFSAVGQWPRWFARMASGLVALVGVLVLLGWVLDIAVLKSVLPSWVTMRANAALAFVLAGVALLLVTMGPIASPSSAVGEKRRLARRLAAQGCAGIVALIGLLTLSEYLTGWNLSIDQL